MRPDWLLELVAAVGLTAIIKAGVRFSGHWVSLELAAAMAVVLVVGGLLIIDAPDWRGWWR